MRQNKNATVYEMLKLASSITKKRHANSREVRGLLQFICIRRSDDIAGLILGKPQSNPFVAKSAKGSGSQVGGGSRKQPHSRCVP